MDILGITVIFMPLPGPFYDYLVPKLIEVHPFTQGPKIYPTPSPVTVWLRLVLLF